LKAQAIDAAGNKSAFSSNVTATRDIIAPEITLN